eukprot:GHVN01036200.1.p1 GENE.GHVN01036200.1~~GHVN01036200.1.p1  ORF type:complete len:556 (-),score=132.48 GHVN01036200.1:555-2222(-)
MSRGNNNLGRPVSFSSEQWGFDSGLSNRKDTHEELNRFYTAAESFDYQGGDAIEEEGEEGGEASYQEADEEEEGGYEEGGYEEEEYEEEGEGETYEAAETYGEEEEEEEEAAAEVEEEAETPPQSYGPHSREKIEEKVLVRETVDKGRCLHSKIDLKPGEIIFVESPVMVAIPSVDPLLWTQLSALHEEVAMDLPPIWHLAALCSLTKLPDKKMQIIADKWVPDDEKDVSEDVIRVLAHTGLNVDPKSYERFLQAWRFNSFGHHTETDGLVLYDRISMMAHDCNSSACWHYGEGDAFVLRARQFISEGDELTISYIGDEDLFKSTPIRREKLSGWQFICHCSRCDSETDVARGFRCPECGSGTCFLNTDEEGVTTSSDCSVCRKVMDEDKIDQYLNFETAYIERLDETGKDDMNDAELVLCEAQRVFTQHWTLFALHTTLFEGRKEEGLLTEAIYHQQKRIEFVSAVLPKATYTLAWLYEEQGDLMSSQVSPTMHDEEGSEREEVALTNHQRNVLTRVYEDGMNLLLILCGDNHDYTLAIYNRIERINQCADAPR